MEIGNVLLLTAIAAFLCSAGTCNAAYKQRDRQQLRTAEPVTMQQLDKERWKYHTYQLSTLDAKFQHRHEYGELKAEPAGETFRHRHQLKKGVSETAEGNGKQKGSSGKKQKGSGGANKGGGRK